MEWPTPQRLFNDQPAAAVSTVSRASMSRVERGEFDVEAALSQIVAQTVNRNRHWDAADNTEENRTQWLRADGRSMNALLVDHYETICARAALEARRNPTVEGVIKTHATDVVGARGPTLQMQTDDDRWNAEAESIWSEVAQAIDGSGKLSLAEWLRQDIYQSWVTGDMLCQIVDDDLANSPIRTRVHSISPMRLKSPWVYSPSSTMMLGIERNKLGRPLAYHIEDEVLSEYEVARYTLTRVPARDIMHYFEMLEPGQIRGWPRLASCLQAISDLREYDNAVLDAAKVQAMMAVLMYTTNEMVEPEANPADVSLKRMGITRIPRGWNAQSLQTSHPNAQNTDFRKERSRDLGRPAQMPLMQIRLDSSGHNYSSARFDAQLYQRANQVIQASIEVHRVRPVAMLVLSEAMERRLLAPRVLRPQETTFRWPQPPHVDPVKEAMAQRIRLENRTLSPQMACDSDNVDFEDVVRQWKRANEILKANGLPEMLGAIPTNLTELMTFLGLNEQPEQGANNANN